MRVSNGKPEMGTVTNYPVPGATGSGARERRNWLLSAAFPHPLLRLFRFLVIDASSADDDIEDAGGVADSSTPLAAADSE
jgi:hypothetical protein